MHVILASASPRRRELLAQIGIEHEVRVSSVSEAVPEGMTPWEIVEELSARKAAAVWKELEKKEFVIGADTVVALAGRVLGKPKDEREAVAMLEALQNGEHEVFTGVTILSPSGDRRTFHDRTYVDFAPMSREEIREYVATKDPLDKAGAYGIQGFCARYIKGIRGDYNNVVGLPIGHLYRELDKMQRSQALKKLAVFDLDGTLSDTIGSLTLCGNTVLKELGLEGFEEEAYQYFAGDGAANLIRRALEAAGDRKCTLFDKAFPRYKEVFAQHCMDGVKPYDGVPQLLKALKEKGILLAVLSNKPHKESIRVVETLFGEGTFDVICGQKEGYPLKPSPDGVFRILEEIREKSGLLLKPENVVYLGDTGTDMQTGRSAGAYTIGVLWGFRKKEELLEYGADEVIASPEEAEQYFGGREE